MKQESRRNEGVDETRSSNSFKNSATTEWIIATEICRTRCETGFLRSPEKKVRSDFAENFSEQREKIGKLGEIRFFSPPLQKQNCIVRIFFCPKCYFSIFRPKKFRKKSFSVPNVWFRMTLTYFPWPGIDFEVRNPSRHLNEKLNHARKEILVSWLPALCRKLILGQRFLFLTRRVKVCSFIKRNDGWHLHSNFK